MKYPICHCQYCGCEGLHYQQEYCSPFCRDMGENEKEVR
jgi:hypothetical protein